MTADFVTRLGSRALVPEEVSTPFGIDAYADLLAPPDDAGRRVERTVRQARALRRIDRDRMRAVLAALATPPNAELNHASLARAVGMPATTIGPYVEVLVELGFVRLLPAATRSAVTKRVVARPRALVTSLPLATHLAGLGRAELVAFAGRSRLAPYLRTLVCLELMRQQPHGRVAHRLGHLRERNGLSVDVLVELEGGGVYGLEVRTAASIRPHQFAGLEALAARAGSHFRGGVVLNTAPRGHRYRPGMWSLPIASIWDEG